MDVLIEGHRYDGSEGPPLIGPSKSRVLSSTQTKPRGSGGSVFRAQVGVGGAHEALHFRRDGVRLSENLAGAVEQLQRLAKRDGPKSVF